MVTIANGSSLTLHVKVENENIPQVNHNESRIEFTFPVVKGNWSSKPKPDSKEAVIVEPGFSVLPKSEVAPFGIPAKKIKFISIFFEDANGQHFIHDKKEVSGDSSWIVTPSGGLIESDPTDPWTGKLDQRSYKFECCDEKCELCILRTSQMCLEDIKDLNVGDRLTRMAATVKRKKSTKRGEKNHLKAAAKQYRSFEKSNKLAVRQIKRYGKNIEEAAEDFERDLNIVDFLKERASNTRVKSSLKTTVNQFDDFLFIWNLAVDEVDSFISESDLDELVWSDREKFDCIVWSTSKVQEKVQIIRTCLEDIDENYEDLNSAVEKVERYKANPEKAKTMVSRVKAKATALVVACENYLKEFS
jgi:hypothetical protein